MVHEQQLASNFLRSELHDLTHARSDSQKSDVRGLSLYWTQTYPSLC